jgi:hypothetical protein
MHSAECSSSSSYSCLSSSTPFYISESIPDFNCGSSSYFDSDSNDQLADKITTLAGQINAATYRFLKMIAEFDRRKTWEGPGIRSCAYWLAWKSGLDIAVA